MTLFPKVYGGPITRPCGYSLQSLLQSLNHPRSVCTCSGLFWSRLVDLVLEKRASRVCWLIAEFSICILCFSYKSFWYRVWVVFVLSLKLGYVSVIWLWFCWTRAFKNIKIPENIRFPIDIHTFSDIFKPFVPTNHYFINSQIIFPQYHPRVSIFWSWYNHKRTFEAAR